MTTKTKVKLLKFNVPIVVKPDSEGTGYYAYSPTLKGICIDGETKEETLTRAVEATKLLLLSMIECGDPISLAMADQKDGFSFTGASDDNGNAGYFVKEIHIEI
jgi:predicted RNase H-like HicB family nuclease